MHHFVTEMCICVHISVKKWCILGYLTSALWDLFDECILPCPNPSIYWHLWFVYCIKIQFDDSMSLTTWDWNPSWSIMLLSGRIRSMLWALKQYVQHFANDIFSLFFLSTKPSVSTLPNEYPCYFNSFMQNITFIFNSIGNLNCILKKKMPNCVWVKHIHLCQNYHYKVWGTLTLTWQ